MTTTHEAAAAAAAKTKTTRTAPMAQRHLRRQSSFSNNYSNDTKKEGEGFFADRTFSGYGSTWSSSSTTASATEKETGITHSYSPSINKNPLKLGKDGAERLVSNAAGVAGSSSSSTDIGYHYQNPLEDDALGSSTSYYPPAAGAAAGLGGISYFPDHVARVSYIASVVKPDANGDYLKDLQGGMDLLATRLAPSFFPGTIVRDITTQVDGYFPAGESS